MRMTTLPVCAAVLLFVVVLLASPEPATPVVDRRYDSIFSFGDSFGDTGNNPAVFAWYSLFDPVTRPPYGFTFFGRPTGRNGDGRLIIDFIAEGLALPYVPPYLGPPFASPAPADGGRFRQGASLAVGAATALDVKFFRERGIPGAHSKFPLNISLGVQLEWFESHLKPSLCRTNQECKEFLSRSLFLVGEFGVNDYHFSFQSRSVGQVRSYVPRVVSAISTAVERLIHLGARALVVPGVIPSGCSPPILAMFADAGPAEYDPRTGCLKAHNELGRHHNALLQASLQKLRARHPHVSIAYADFFRIVVDMVESPHKFGFREDVLTVCCGGPGKNHYNGTVFCGDPRATTCRDPSASLYWDGVHFTEAANRYIAHAWLSTIKL